jgi:type VI protein secretion system component Hcp
MKTQNKDLFTIPKLDFLEQELQEQEQKFEELFLEFSKEDDITEFEEVEFITDEFEPFEIEDVEFEIEDVEFEIEDVEFEFEEIEFEIKPLEEL